VDHVAQLLVELGLPFSGLSLLGLLARRLGLSSVPFVLVAALAVGEGGVVPLATSEPFIEAAAEIGVVLLLLALGLEFSADELFASLGHHGPSGLVDLLLNALPGFAAGLLLGLMANRETPAVLSVLVLEDLAMALFLPLLVALAGGGSLTADAGTGLAVGAVALALLAAQRQGHRLGRLLGSAGDEQLLLRLVGLTLLVAGLAQSMGASAAVGAFLVGFALPASSAERARTVLAPLRDLFVATFFVTFGLSTDPAALVPVLPAVLLLALVTTGTKVATGWFAARRDGVAVPGRIRAGTALVARGEFSIVIAGLAVTAGIPELGPLATGYVLVLAVVGPLLTRVVEPRGLRAVPPSPA
jgi:CPA2 family monovalent cation:H+ antiporter-2